MECRILMPSLDADFFRWCKRDDKTGDVVDQGEASSDQLKQLYSGSQQLVFFVPQQDVLMTSHQFPARANKQQINAIGYSIEENLAQDVDHCFFTAASQQPDLSLPVAIVERQKMDRYAESLSQFQLNAQSILPSFYLCPWTDEEGMLASVCEVDDGYLIRYGQHQGVFCNQSTLPVVIQLITQNTSADSNRIEWYSDHVPEFDLPEQVELQQKSAINLLGQALDYKQCINLKQKEYDTSYQLWATIAYWKWPFLLLLLLLAIMLGKFFIELQHNQSQLDSIKQQQLELVRQYLPEADADNPKSALIDALSDARNGNQAVEFVDLLHEFSRLKSSFNGVKILRVQYQQNRLMVNLESGALKAMEDFRNSLSQSLYPARIEDVNISPEKTSGKLVMEATS